MHQAIRMKWRIAWAKAGVAVVMSTVTICLVFTMMYHVYNW